MVNYFEKFFFINGFVFFFYVAINSHGNNAIETRLSEIYDAYINHEKKPNTDKIVRVLQDRKVNVLSDQEVQKGLTEFMRNIDPKLPHIQEMKKRFEGVYEDTLRGCTGTKLNTDFATLFFLAEVMNTFIESSIFDRSTIKRIKSSLKEVTLGIAKNVKGFERKFTLMELLSAEGLEAFENQFRTKSGLHLLEID